MKKINFRCHLSMIRLMIKNNFDWLLNYFKDQKNDVDEEVKSYVFNVINNSSREELLEIGEKLNHWEWPFELYKDYRNGLSGNFSRRKNIYTIYKIFLDKIGLSISIKDALRYHNNQMTIDEFEYWWKNESMHNGNQFCY